MADEPETMAEVRARANSHDGCPTDIFDRALAAHDARVRRDAAREALCGLRESHAQTVSILAADSQARFYEEKILLRIDRYRDTHHPELGDIT